MILTKSELSSENISSTNEVSIHAVPMFHSSTPNTIKPQQFGNIIIRPVTQMKHHQTMPAQSNSRSSQSTPSPTTTTANTTAEIMESQFDPIVKMEVPDDDDNDDDNCSNNCMEPKSCENGNFNYVGEFIAAELNKLPLRDAFVLKNILLRQVLNFSERAVTSGDFEK